MANKKLKNKKKFDRDAFYEITNLDRSKTSLQDRLEEVNSRLEPGNIFEDYFDNRYNPNLTGSMDLSENDIACKSLEKMADYLLLSDESKKIDRDSKNEYTIHKDRKKFIKKINRESFNSEDGNVVDNENTLHYLVKQRNDYVLKHQKITREDLKKDTETARVLREYDNFLQHINEKLLEKPDSKWFMYSRAKSQVRDDMINVKNMLDGVWGDNISSTTSHVEQKYDVIDFTDYKTVEFYLSVDEPEFVGNLEIWLIWLEFNDTMNKANLTNEEKCVAYFLGKQWNIKEISDFLEIDYNRVRRTVINNIVKKIIKVGNKYDSFDLKNKYKIANRKNPEILEEEKEDADDKN